jgi:hypothetical protein
MGARWAGVAAAMAQAEGRRACACRPLSACA